MNKLWINKADELWKAQEVLKRMDDTVRRLKAELQQLSENQSHIEGNYAYIKEIRKGTINYAAIEVLREIDLDQYRRDNVVSWKLSKVGE